VRRMRVLLAVLLTAGSLGYVVAGGLREAVVYYLTPTEVRSMRPEPHRPVRVGGQVLPGSLRREGPEVRFILWDGQTQLPVRFRGTVEGLLAEAQGAVVEGRVVEGILHARTVVVKHSEEYTPSRTPHDRPRGP